MIDFGQICYPKPFIEWSVLIGVIGPNGYFGSSPRDQIGGDV